MATEENGPGKSRGLLRRAGRTITLPVRSVASSFSMAGKSFKRSAESISVVKDYSSRGISNIKSAGKKGANNAFETVFEGEEGEQLLSINLRKFLLRKRAAIAMMLIFTIYGMASVIYFKQFYGLLTFVGGILFGATLCFESQFRLWQLRNRRLSIEEKGSVTDFLYESPLLDMLKPELFGSTKK
ncbi:hypothetical protein [Halomonas campaniensis]|uniref:hypothetical protein n=1 Tax=Halomonas campaniensis TaxID=213554 RepID=UPI000B538AAD|nr:hypothetical protein [Halomonas campaniensis]